MQITELDTEAPESQHNVLTTAADAEVPLHQQVEVEVCDTPRVRPQYRSSFQHRQRMRYASLRELVQAAQITVLTKQLQAQKLRTDALHKELQEAHSLRNKTIALDLRLVERLIQDNQALKQRMEEMMRLQRQKEEAFASQVTDLMSSNLELACQLRAEKEATQQQQRQVEALQQQLMSQVTCEPRSDDLQPEEDIREDNAPQEVPDQQQQVSLWRRFKKCMTPKHRRQYKNQRANRE